MIYIIVVSFFLVNYKVVVSQPTFSFTAVDLPSSSVGPESITFDTRYEEEPYYTGISDGRIIKYHSSYGFVDYAYTVQNRSKVVCDGIGINRTSEEVGQKCGRPLGLGFNLKTKQLYVADAYNGFLVVPYNVTFATQIANESEGIPFKLLTGLDVDQSTGNVYFTDATSNFNLSQIQEAIDTGDSTGRLLKYDNATQQITVLLRNLSGAGGTSISLDGSFVLVSEFIANRIQKYWLTGPKAFTSHILIAFQGRPINIKRTLLGEFWVAVNMNNNGTNVPMGIKINANGNITRTVDLSPYYGSANISEFQQRNREFYVGTLRTPFLGRLSI